MDGTHPPQAASMHAVHSCGLSGCCLRRWLLMAPCPSALASELVLVSCTACVPRAVRPSPAVALSVVPPAPKPLPYLPGCDLTRMCQPLCIKASPACCAVPQSISSPDLVTPNCNDTLCALCRRLPRLPKVRQPVGGSGSAAGWRTLKRHDSVSL